MRLKFTKILLAGLLSVLGSFSPASAQVQPPTKMGAMVTPQINTDYYVGQIPGYYASIQSAVTKVCATTGGRVIIPAATTPTDSIGTVTGGCSSTNVDDRRVSPDQYYGWDSGTSHYVAIPYPGLNPVGIQYATQLRGINSNTLAPGIVYDSTTVGALNPGSSIYRVSNYVDPNTAGNLFPHYYPWQQNQFVDYRTSFNPFVQAHTANVRLTSGVVDWLAPPGFPGGGGNFPNATGIGINLISQTPYQLGGTINVEVHQHSGDDSVVMTVNNHCGGIRRGDNEACEAFRWFMDFAEDQFGGTMALFGSGVGALGNPLYTITQTGSYSTASAGEQRTFIDVTKKVTPSGNVTVVDRAFVDPSGGAPRFVKLTVDSNHGLGTSTVGLLLGGADYQQYNRTGGVCPFPIVSPVTWPANTDPYASPAQPGASPGTWVSIGVDGTNTKTQQMCLDISGGSWSTGDHIGIFAAGVNYEYTTIQAVNTTGGHTYALVNLVYAHEANSLVVKGGGTGWGWQGVIDQTQNGFVWPIIYTPDSTHVVLWADSASTFGPKLISLIYPNVNVQVPLTITPSITGGVVTSITTNAASSNYQVVGPTVTNYFPQPILTFSGAAGAGGHCTGADPTFTWTFTGGSQPFYTPTLATGGSGCAGLLIHPQSVYPNPYNLYPTTQTQFVDNPTLWTQYMNEDVNTRTDQQRDAISTTGFIGVQPWAGTTPSVGDTLAQTPMLNRFMGSQENFTSDPYSSKAASRQGPMSSRRFSLAVRAPMEQSMNAFPASYYIGQPRNGFGPGPTNAPPCPAIDTGNPNDAPCYSPTDNQFFAPFGKSVIGPLSNSYVTQPPLFDYAQSRPGAILFDSCDAPVGVDGGEPAFFLPCFFGIKTKKYVYFNGQTNKGMLYDENDNSYKVEVADFAADSLSVPVSTQATTEKGFQLKHTDGVTVDHWNSGVDWLFDFFTKSSTGHKPDATEAAGKFIAGDIVAGAGGIGSPLVFNLGGTGSTTYSYAATGVTANGETPIGPVTTFPSGPASSPNFVLKLNPVDLPPGATGISLYRLAGPGGAGKICNNVTPQSITDGSNVCSDTGQAAGAAPPTSDTSGRIFVNGYQACNSHGDNCPAAPAAHAAHQMSLTSTSIPDTVGGGILLGAPFFEPYAVTLVDIEANMTINSGCSGTPPTVVLLDLGTSPSTVYSSATVVTSLVTDLSNGLFSGTGLSVSLTANHYYRFGYSAATCADAVVAELTATVQQ